MKQIVFIIGLLGLSIALKGQTTRYFEFSTTCGHGNWQDSSFVAATSNPTIIDTVLANIARPLVERKFIGGEIDYGNGGHNHNATHWFLWHFVPNQWNLIQMAIEICDGCPFSDLDADTATWVGTMGYFCPWSGRPMREVSNPSAIHDPLFENELVLYPNPATDVIRLKGYKSSCLSVVLYNSIGQQLFESVFSKKEPTLDASELKNGLYFLKITEGDRMAIKTLIIDRK